MHPVKFELRDPQPISCLAPRCDYREFRPDPCGTLIADLVDELATVATIALDFEDWESPCRTIDEHFSTSKCRESGSRNNPVLDQQEFGRLDQREAAFPVQEGKRRCHWLAPAKRRVAGIGGVIPRPEESLPRAPVPVVPLPWAPGRLCPSLNAYATADTTQQRNTHNIESREVRYPWHPWCGRVVAVHQTFAKNGWVVSHCSIEENAEARHLEIPEWMFDPVICRRTQLAAVPTVSCEALLDLKSLLRCAPCPDTDVVLQPQHRSLLSPGGADAKIIKSQGRSIHTVSSTTQKSGLAGIASRNKTESSETLRATAARVLRKTPRRRPQRGGGR